MNNSYIRDESAFLYHSALICSELRSGADGAWQVAPFQCSIPYSDTGLDRLERLKATLKLEFPELFAYGENRAKKAYYSPNDSITKPSYISRLLDYRGSGQNQIDVIVDIAAKERASGGLVFSVFSPEDLIDRRRPGYVPCLVSGSILEHEGELQLNAFFRSQSVVEFGVFDLEFLRRLQLETVNRLNGLRKRRLSMGSLNLHFARIIIQRRLVRNRQGFIRRDAVLERWLRVVEELMLTG